MMGRISLSALQKMISLLLFVPKAAVLFGRTIIHFLQSIQVSFLISVYYCIVSYIFQDVNRILI